MPGVWWRQYPVPLCVGLHVSNMRVCMCGTFMCAFVHKCCMSHLCVRVFVLCALIVCVCTSSVSYIPSAALLRVVVCHVCDGRAHAGTHPPPMWSFTSMYIPSPHTPHPCPPPRSLALRSTCVSRHSQVFLSDPSYSFMARFSLGFTVFAFGISTTTGMHLLTRPYVTSIWHQPESGTCQAPVCPLCPRWCRLRACGGTSLPRMLRDPFEWRGSPWKLCWDFTQRCALRSALR